jgi:5'/3'-nucleotidase
MQKLKVLITNDDGIEGPGLHSLWRAIREEADVTIVAPLSERSGAGMGVTFDRHIDVRPYSFEEGAKAWTVSGTPGDCVRMGLRLVMQERPDLILTGINPGGNAGRNLFYSGTVGAAMEAVLSGIPAVAFSCEYSKSVAPTFDIAERFIPNFLRMVRENPLPPATLLNINFPATVDPKGVRIARQGQGFWGVQIESAGEGRYWLPGRSVSVEEPEESDIALLEAGYITVVPINFGEMTHHSHRVQLIDKVKSYF